jgi:hypothetical protein
MAPYDGLVRGSRPASAPRVGGRLSLVALVVLVFAAALWDGVAGGSPRAASGPEALTLRLSDLRPGYLVGDDGGCGLSLAGEAAPRALVRLGRRYRHRGCVIQFERLWVPPGGPPAPALVESAAIEFQGEAGAVAGFEAARAVIAYTTGVPRDSLERRAVTVTLGDSVAVVHTNDALVEGRTGRPGVAVLWRTGRMLSFVFVGGEAGAAGEALALGLAQLQQGRIEVPTPLLPTENDDRTVPLDNPGLGVPVYWLGPRLRPPGRLPTLVLEDSFGPLGRHNGPGRRAEIDYSAGDRRGGVKLGLWRPQAFARFSTTRLGRLVRTQRCARAMRLVLPTGRAVIYAGHGNPPKRCGRRPPNLYLAHVFLGDVVLTINVPVCFLCVELVRGVPHPYNTLAGLRTVIKALEPRP